jgi:hypothetical protein
LPVTPDVTKMYNSAGIRSITNTKFSEPPIIMPIVTDGSEINSGYKILTVGEIPRTAVPPVTNATISVM